MRTFFAVLLFCVPACAGRDYYLDCAGGSNAASGDSPGAAWKTLAQVARTTFGPGDSLRVRRGTHCSGTLAPKGSGEQDRPARIGAYGEGPLPLIDGGTAEAAIKLADQHHWEIENLETTGGTPFGVLVSGNRGTLQHFHLRNLVVHDVGGEAQKKASGLVAVLAGPDAAMEDVVLDGITAHHTTQWAGIIVQGGSPASRIRNVVVRNSIVHDVFGDGIILFQVENGLIEKSVAWLTGLQPVQKIGTPNGIWTWRCRHCTVQLTEGFRIDSPGVDGGVYDIDWGNEANTVQYNYGHDAQGYCAAVFAAGGIATSESVIRYNVCVDNGRSPKLARRQGDLYISTWNGGALNGVLIHNNTFVWNPLIDAPAVQIDQAEFSGGRNLFANNLVLSSVPSMIHSSRRLELQHNLFWHGGARPPKWDYGGLELDFHPYAAVAADMFASPKLDALLRPSAGSMPLGRALVLPEMGAADAFGAPVLRRGAYDIGAISFAEAVPEEPSAAPEWVPLRPGMWQLILLDSPEARSQLPFVQAALAQYEGLAAGVGFETPGGNIAYDWNLGAVRAFGGAPRGPGLLMISPGGKVERQWRRFVTPAELGLTLRHLLKTRRPIL